MSKRKSCKAKHSSRKHIIENKIASNIDDLDEFEEFRATILPGIRSMLAKGCNAKEILEKYKPLVAARLLNTALVADSQHSTTAIKEVLDRVDGKVTTTLDLTHKYDKLKEDQLDALINSKLQNKTIVVDPSDPDESPA